MVQHIAIAVRCSWIKGKKHGMHGGNKERHRCASGGKDHISRRIVLMPITPICERSIHKAWPCFACCRCTQFDCDGVLVDTERDGHRISFNEAFKRKGKS